MQRISGTEAVRAILRSYIEATRTGDAAAMKELFHDEAMVVGWFGDALREGRPTPFFERVAQGPAEDAYAAAITEIDVIGRSATATIIEENLWGGDFVNRFHLIQTAEGDWTITAKLFHRTRAEG